MATVIGDIAALSATEVIGTSVKDLAGETIGQIEDFVLDEQSNTILFAVVGCGGFLGFARRYHRIPWSDLHYRPSDDCYGLTYARERLQVAPVRPREALTQMRALASERTAIAPTRHLAIRIDRGE